MNSVAKYMFFILLSFLLVGTGISFLGSDSGEKEETGKQSSGAALLAGGSHGHTLYGSNVAGSAAKGKKGKFKVGFKDSQGRNIRWNGCKPIKWRYNKAGQRKNGLKHAKAAMRKASKVSGLKYVYKGTTKKKTISQKYPKGTDVVVAWVNPKHRDLVKYGPTPTGNTYVVGVGIVEWKWWIKANGAPTPAEIVKGNILLNKKAPMKNRVQKKAFMHEVGHVVGLGHVNSKKELMYPTVTPSGKAKWGPGDKKGLKKLGRKAGCFKNPIR